MGQAKEKKTTLELKDIYFSSGQTVVESPPDIWLQMEAKQTEHFNKDYFPGIQKRIYTTKFVFLGQDNDCKPYYDLLQNVSIQDIQKLNCLIKFPSIEQSAVVGPVQLSVDPSHRLFRMAVQAVTETAT